jgi:hypothetical protein
MAVGTVGAAQVAPLAETERQLLQAGGEVRRIRLRIRSGDDLGRRRQEQTIAHASQTEFLAILPGLQSRAQDGIDPDDTVGTRVIGVVIPIQQ